MPRVAPLNTPRRLRMSLFPRRAVALALLALTLGPASLLATGSRRTDSRAVASAPAAVGVVRGRVTERESGQPVVAAQVLVVGTRTGTVSDANGNYILRGVEAGQVTIR